MNIIPNSCQADCKWFQRNFMDPCVCTHPKSPKGDEFSIGSEETPPHWCPLRNEVNKPSIADQLREILHDELSAEETSFFGLPGVPRVSGIEECITRIIELLNK